MYNFFYLRECIFESLNILYANIANPKVQVIVRLNSIFALKIILGTCNYVVVNLIETYFLNMLVIIASYDPDKQGKQRGLNFFI